MRFSYLLTVWVVFFGFGIHLWIFRYPLLLFISFWYRLICFECRSFSLSYFILEILDSLGKFDSFGKCEAPKKAFQFLYFSLWSFILNYNLHNLEGTHLTSNTSNHKNLLWQDARVAAEQFEIENDLFVQEKQRRREEENVQILKRGKAALTKEKSHNNYLRLLAELDKIETNNNTKWDVESTISTPERSSTSILSCEEPCIINEVPVRDENQHMHQESPRRTHSSFDQKDAKQVPAEHLPLLVPPLDEGIWLICFKNKKN